MEARGKVIAIEEDALGRGNRAERGASVATDASVDADGLAERAELLGMVTVSAEGGVRGTAGEGSREGIGWRGGMGLGRVVDGRC
jgi:hypothetical protein